MPVVKEGTIWIVKGDTRPIKDVLSAAGAVWQPQRVIPIPAPKPLMLPKLKIAIAEQVGQAGKELIEPDKLAEVLRRLRDVLRGAEEAHVV